MKLAPTFQSFGSHAVLISWPSEIKEEIHDQVLIWQQFLMKKFGTVDVNA